MKAVWIYASVFLLINFCIPKIFATPWTAEQKVASRLNMNALIRQFPAITQPEDLEKLLQTINRLQPFWSLEAQFYDQKWIIYGEPADVISEINLSLVTSQLKQTLMPIRQDFIGHVDSSDSRKKILERIKTALTQNGFPNFEVGFLASKAGNQVTYNISIDEGIPCQIQTIHLPFHLSEKVGLKLRQGDICSVEQISVAIDNFEDELRVKGYTQVQLGLGNIVYNYEKTSCDVFITGSLGQKIQHIIVDESTDFDIDELLTAKKYATIDFNINDPEVMREEIMKFYWAKGYEDVKVNQPIVKKRGENTTEYTYYVTPGLAYTIEEIEFEGNHHFSKEELIDIIGISNFWNIPPPLNREEINEGIDRIETEYVAAGYWDVKILSPRITRNKSSTSSQIVIIINEGKKRLYNGIEFHGNTVFAKEELQNLVSLKRGDPLNKQHLVGIEENIRSLYLKNGYLYATLKINILSEEQVDRIATNLSVEINEDKRVKIGLINILGLVKTDPKVVARQLRFKQGDWYNPELLDESRKDLINLGIFSSVQISAAELSTQAERPNVINLLVELQEGRSGNISFGPGYNIKRGLNYVGEFAYNNISGLGRQLSLRAAFSQEKHQSAIGNAGDRVGKTFLGRKLGAGYVEPYMFDLPVDGRISFSHLGVADNIWKISNVFELGAIHKLSYELGGKSTVTGFYNLKQSKDEGSKLHELSLVTTGNSRIGSIGARFQADSRDSLAWPSEGNVFSTELQLARYLLGGNYHFLKYEIKNNHFFSLTDNLVLALGASIVSFEKVHGRVHSDEIDVLPSTERLSAKGGNLVRGFKEELGPYVEINGSKSILGGTRRFVGKSELRYRFKEMFGLSLFLDSGNTFLSDNEFNKFARQFSKMESKPIVEDNVSYEFKELLYRPGYLFSRNYLASGISFNWLTPLGAVNASLAWPISEPKTIRCQELNICFPRAKIEDNWLLRYQFDLSVGADF